MRARHLDTGHEHPQRRCFPVLFYRSKIVRNTSKKMNNFLKHITGNFATSFGVC